MRALILFLTLAACVAHSLPPTPSRGIEDYPTSARLELSLCAQSDDQYVGIESDDGSARIFKCPV